MSRSIVLLNGVPGAGKTTLSAPFARELDATLISKDAIKEALADAVAASLPTSRLGALASDTMWRLAAMVDGLAVVESFWATERDEQFLRAGLTTAGAERAIEVWCEVPLELARERYITRPRHHAHSDDGRLAEWDVLAAAAQPCSGQPVLPVDTSSAVDVGALARQALALLGSPRSTVIPARSAFGISATSSTR
jgi:predicted kinase